MHRHHFPQQSFFPQSFQRHNVSPLPSHPFPQQPSFPHFSQQASFPYHFPQHSFPQQTPSQSLSQQPSFPQNYFPEQPISESSTQLHQPFLSQSHHQNLSNAIQQAQKRADEHKQIQTQRQAKSSDAWIRSFVERQKQTDSKEWTKSKVREKLRTMSKLISSMKNILNSSSQADLVSDASKSVQLREMKEELERLYADFSGENYTRFLVFKAKILRSAQKKRWRLRKSKAKRAEKKLLDALQQRQAQRMDEWRVRIQQKQEQLAELQKAAKERIENESEYIRQQKNLQKLQDTLASLNLLVKLRREKISRQGQFSEHEDHAFYERMQAQHEAELKERARQTALSSGSACASPLPSLLPEQPTASDSVDLDSFYSASQHDLSKLIEIRKKWDSYLVPAGQGTRIPAHFVVTPPPSNPDWAVYLISKPFT